MSVVIGLLWLTAIAAHTQAISRRNTAVRGSYERHQAATQAVFTSAATLALSVAVATSAALAGNWCLAIAVLFLGTPFWIMILKENLDDDDWFGGQKRRLKRRLKSLRTRSLTVVPRLSPT